MATNAAAADSDSIVQVLFALHDKFDILDFAGPLEVLNLALHNIKDASSKAFDVTLAGADGGAGQVLSSAGVLVGSQITWKEAHAQLEDYDVLIVLGGNSDAIIKNKSEPLDLITRYTQVQTEDPSRERTLLSICTGSLLLGHLGILIGLTATTHPDSITKLMNICKQATQHNLAEHTDVQEGVRYIVNNLRFELGDEDENPYIRNERPDGRRPSNARKGSVSLQRSNTRRESRTRRAAMRLSGLRVITSAGNTAGIDAALYLVSALVSMESAREVARLMDHVWIPGTVIDGVDV